MRVLVTGGAGFIGSHIVDALLAAGHEAHVVDDLSSGRLENISEPESVSFFEADIRDGRALAAAFDVSQPDAVCHHAAQVSVGRSVADPALDAEINIVGTLNVITESVRVGARSLVFASSGGAFYGETPEAADESTAATPISPYGIGKWTVSGTWRGQLPSWDWLRSPCGTATCTGLDRVSKAKRASWLPFVEISRPE